MKKLAIIPARGGSKRIPRKNIKAFLGKPILAYSIEAALQSGLFDEVMVSTDDEEIASMAREYGAAVPFMRSSKNADDFATTADVLLEVLDNYHSRQQHFGYACCIYPTAPLIRKERLVEAYELMLEKQFKSVLPVGQFSYPILRSLKMDAEQKLAMNWPEHLNSRSQDLPAAYHDAGQFYWFSTDYLLEGHPLLGDQSGAIVLPETEVQDIDNLSDWQMAEIKYKLLVQNQNT